MEFELLEAAGEDRAVHGAQRQAGLLGQGDVDQDLGEHARAIGVVPALAQLLQQGALEHLLWILGLGPGLLQLLQRCVDAVHVVVGGQQVDGGLGPDTAHAWDVVGAVAGERLEVDHLLGRHAQLGEHPLAAHLGRAAVLRVGAATHVEHGDVTLVVDQLEQVAVAREDAHPPALVRGPIGQGAEHVVGLVAGGHCQGDVETLGQDPLQVGQILEKLFRRLVAVRLVGRVGLVAEGGLGRVEGHHQAIGLQPLAVVEQGLEEAVGDAGGDPCLGAQAAIAPLGEGVVAAEGQRMAVDQQQQGLGAGGHDFRGHGFRGHGFGRQGSGVGERRWRGGQPARDQGCGRVAALPIGASRLETASDPVR